MKPSLPLRFFLLGVLLAPALHGAATERSAEAPPPARVSVVRETGGAAGGPWVAASVASVRRATLSTRLSATVRDLLVEEGDRVRRGQLLLVLSDDDVRAQLSAARTALANAEAYERRIASLAKERAATPVELEQAQAQRAQAAAAVAGAKASLAYTQIRAPFDGSIQARKVNRGDLVGPGQPLLEVEGAGLEIQANLSEEEAQGLSLGMRLPFEAGDQKGEVEITALTPGGDPLSHRRGLRARVVSGGEGILSGSFARMQLPAGAATAEVWVPRSAVVQRGDLTGVFVAEGGRAELRWISVGEPAGDKLPVRAGLEPNELVIDSPGPLTDGQPVEVARGDR